MVLTNRYSTSKITKVDIQTDTKQEIQHANQIRPGKTHANEMDTVEISPTSFDLLMGVFHLPLATNSVSAPYAPPNKRFAQPNCWTNRTRATVQAEPKVLFCVLWLPLWNTPHFPSAC
ncbi:hypothetical protein EG68_03084 [Paragonimus skrjabini miyazakii]|uniref:Uncharacterized protein n=1 Tax=Paragonimus skrjabini miyazakii TaxID=59628 RepID=A0A8S9YW20_9TREM|nr:hypothetical protein EG68_03084 [Paragonimus skrjabini miyazakii]